MNHQLPILLATVLLILSCNHKPADVPSADSQQVNAYTDTANINIEGVSRIPMDGFEFIAIHDHDQSMGANLFKGVNDKLLSELLPQGSAPASINVFLLASPSFNCLVDAGMGAGNGGLLLQKLKALNLDPSKIDAVVLTHLHPDHIGGMVYDNAAAFPNAQVFISTKEFDAWTNGALKGRNQKVMEMLSFYANNINLFNDGDTIPLSFVNPTTGLPCSFVAHVLSGHTPGHSIFLMDHRILFAADLVHAQSLQMDHPEFSARYDFDKKTASADRTQWIQFAKDNHLIMAGAHFPEPAYIDFSK